VLLHERLLAGITSRKSGFFIGSAQMGFVVDLMSPEQGFLAADSVVK